MQEVFIFNFAVAAVITAYKAQIRSGTVYVQGNGIFVGTGAIKVPTGTTGTRPAVPQQGMIRFNTTDGEWEGYDGVEWRFIGGDADEDYGSITSASDVFVDYGSLT